MLVYFIVSLTLAVGTVSCTDCSQDCRAEFWEDAPRSKPSEICKAGKEWRQCLDGLLMARCPTVVYPQELNNAGPVCDQPDPVDDSSDVPPKDTVDDSDDDSKTGQKDDTDDTKDGRKKGKKGKKGGKGDKKGNKSPIDDDDDDDGDETTPDTQAPTDDDDDKTTPGTQDDLDNCEGRFKACDDKFRPMTNAARGLQKCTIATGWRSCYFSMFEDGCPSDDKDAEINDIRKGLCKIDF